MELEDFKRKHKEVFFQFDYFKKKITFVEYLYFFFVILMVPVSIMMSIFLFFGVAAEALNYKDGLIDFNVLLMVGSSFVGSLFLSVLSLNIKKIIQTRANKIKGYLVPFLDDTVLSELYLFKDEVDDKDLFVKNFRGLINSLNIEWDFSGLEVNDSLDKILKLITDSEGNRVVTEKIKLYEMGVGERGKEDLVINEPTKEFLSSRI